VSRNNKHKRNKISQHDLKLIRRHLRIKQNKLCAKCNIRMREGRKFYPTLDHVIPISKGGPDSYDNLILLCYPCNQNKGDTIDPELVTLCKRIWNGTDDPSKKRRRQTEEKKNPSN
jgi:5-methylcytosine-specific restriction endonuclease McrA